MWHRGLLNEAHENRQKIFSAAKHPPLLIIPLSNESTAEEFLFLSKPHDPGHHLHFQLGETCRFSNFPTYPSGPLECGEREKDSQIKQALLAKAMCRLQLFNEAFFVFWKMNFGIYMNLQVLSLLLQQSDVLCTRTRS